jgi:uncharacterized membrane protein YedE/YeeE
MRWGTFFTILGQVGIVLVILFVVLAAAAAIVPDLRNVFGKKK